MLTPAALINIWAGHYGFLLGALFLFGWRNLEDRPWRSGLFFGLMLVKPHLAVLVPFALAVRGDWRAFASAVLTAAALVMLTAWWFGVQPWLDFLFRTSGVQASMIDAGGKFFGPTRDLALLVTTCTFLVLPYAFNYDMTVVMVAALAALTRDGATAGERRLATYGFLAPQLGMVVAYVAVPLMPVMIAGLAVAQFRQCCPGVLRMPRVRAAAIAS